MKLRIALAALALLAASSPAALAAGDVEKGKAVFKRCQVCHVHDTKTNKVGPHLGDVVGRKAASLPDYEYSDALRGQTAWTWTPEQLHAYLSQPAKRANPGTKMKYDGLPDQKQLDDLITYLGTLH